MTKQELDTVYAVIDKAKEQNTMPMIRKMLQALMQERAGLLEENRAIKEALRHSTKLLLDNGVNVEALLDEEQKKLLHKGRA